MESAQAEPIQWRILIRMRVQQQQQQQEERE